MVPARVVSLAPALRWEDAMISGNGSTGVMVMGRPLDERIVINHEKLWVVSTENAPETPDLSDVWARAREMALEGRYRDADELRRLETRAALAPILEAEGIPDAPRLPYDHIHPGLHMHVDLDAAGAVEDYRRETVLDTGEVIVSWRDSRGTWRRRVFVSRTDDVIVLELTPPPGEHMRCRLRLTEAPGKRPGEMGPVTVRHAADEMYYHAAYARRMGRPEPEGYHLLARVVPTGGSAYAIEDERVEISDAERLLVIMRLEYLDSAGAADVEALRSSLSELPADYEPLRDAHAAVHGEMFRRVTLDLGIPEGAGRSSEELIADSEERGTSPEILEMLHAVGRYALISGGTGELPVALSGIWGDTWNPAWDGRYTFDANINLAISGASAGDLPEVMDAYAGYIERSMADWSENARKLFGCRGVLPDLCQGWRHGVAVMLYPWVGGAGWLGSYLYDHFLYTRDREFLAERVVQLLREVALFYEDFLAGTEGTDGRLVFYPSVSPENSPVTDDPSQASVVVPNATCDVAICREALANL
ncbi:MAG: glycosyl hydrolase family 95 catalytic domain-containing protein, partial [Planctomycetota bacterium]